MPSLLGDKAARWLRERMDSGDWRTVPRRLHHAGAKGTPGDSCCLGMVSYSPFPTGALRASIYHYQSGSSATVEEVTVLCPNMGGLTRLAAGDVIVLHKCQVDEYEGEEVEETEETEGEEGT